MINVFAFGRRYLDPASRLGEILFGLIMVLTVTLTAGLTLHEEGRAGVRALLLAAIGCNVAWGIIDAVMYLMNCLVEQTEKTRLIRSVQNAREPAAAHSLVEDELRQGLTGLLDPEERRLMSQAILKNMGRAHLEAGALTKKDFYGALACFWLVFLSCLPAALPFLFVRQPVLALRVSNFLLIVLLFLVGRKWGQRAGVNGMLSGSAMVAVGLILVGVAILLGG
jgi:hypothetical protein